MAAVGYSSALAIRYVFADSVASLKVPALFLIGALALAAIVAYLFLGYFDTLGWVTKAIGSALVIAVLAATLQSKAPAD